MSESRIRVVKTSDGVAHLKIRLESMTMCGLEDDWRYAKRGIKADCLACIGMERAIDELDGGLA